MEWIKEWWAVICGFVATIFWLSRIEHILSERKNNPIMTKAMCDECRSGCMRGNAIQFSNAEKEFADIKRMIHDNHRELIGLIVKADK